LTPAVQTVLTVLLVLEIKHFIFDYPLQTAYQLKNKVKYGHLGGVLHAALHALGTSAIFLVVRPSLGIGIAILAGEFLVHYHLDWAKGQLTMRSGLTVQDGPYWWMIGVDQLLHQLTYLAIAAVLISTSGAT
jgi:uncharacterized protein DUF3307